MPLRRPLSVLAVALVVQACAIASTVSGARSWTQAAGGVDGSSSVITVNDRSGRVQDIELDPDDAVARGRVAVVPGKPAQLDVPWTGGSCDRQTDIDIAAAAAGLAVSVKVTPDETKPCDAMGVIHTLRLQLDQPIAPGLVVVRQ